MIKNKLLAIFVMPFFCWLFIILYSMDYGLIKGTKRFFKVWKYGLLNADKEGDFYG